MKSSRSTAQRRSRPPAPWRATRESPAAFPLAQRLRPRSFWENVRKTPAKPSSRLYRRFRSATSQRRYSKESSLAGSTQTTANPERCPHRGGSCVQEGDQEGAGGAAEEEPAASRRQGTGL